MEKNEVSKNSQIMNRRILIFTMVLFALVTSLFYSCGLYKRAYDLSKNLSWQNFFPETVSMKSPNKNPYYFFISGWYPEGKEIYMTSPVAKIRFFNFSNRDRNLYFKVRKGNFFDKKKVHILIFVNKNKCREIFAKSSEEEIKIPVKKEFLKEGENFLKFELGEEEKRIFQEKHTKKPHRLIFLKDVEFLLPFPKPFSKKSERIFQPANSAMEFFFVPLGKILLRYEVENLSIGEKETSKATLKISILSKEGKIISDKILQLKNSEKRKGNISLKSFAGKLIGIRLIYKAKNPMNRLLWKKLALTGMENKKASPKFNGRIKGKPNIFLILIDAARYNTIIEKKELVPNITKFSKQAFSFKKFYTSAPYTAASVATYMTGLYPEAHGIRDVKNIASKKLLTLPEELRNIGYSTLLITGSAIPIRTGISGRFDKTVYIGKIGFLNDSTMKEKLMVRTLRKINPYKPNFVYIHILPPHYPYNPPPQFYIIKKTLGYNQMFIKRLVRRYEKDFNPPPKFIDWLYNCYLNNIYYADYLVGKVLDTIKSMGLYEKSLIVVSTDHGEAFYEHYKFDHNTTNYQEMIHIPFFLKMPGQKEAKSVEKTAYSNVDFAPTIYDLLGIKPKLKTQGTSLAPLLLGKPDKLLKRWLYSRANSDAFNIGLTDGKTKYIYYKGRDEIYNLEEDDKEKHNLAPSKPLLTGLLRQKAFGMLKRNKEYNKTHDLKPFSKKKIKKFRKVLESLGYIN